MSTDPQSDNSRIQAATSPSQLTPWLVAALSFVPAALVCINKMDMGGCAFHLVVIAALVEIHRRSGRAAASRPASDRPSHGVPAWIGSRGRSPATKPLASMSLSERIDEASLPLEAPPRYGLPRRFGVRGPLIAVTWAALLMGGLRAMGATPDLFFIVLTFVAGMLAAQVLLFGGRDPLTASMAAGALLLPTASLIASVLRHEDLGPVYRYFDEVATLVPFGVVLGATAGPLCGMTYALSESLLLWIVGGLPAIRLEPITPADSDVLLAWIRGPSFCQRWSGGQLTYPLDRNQLLARFAAAAGGEPQLVARFAAASGNEPSRLIFKAVDARSGRMAGYVEIGRIDRVLQRGRLELPLVDPQASERDRLGVLLLQATAEKAFRELGLVELSMVLDSDRSDFALCCKRAWGAKTDEFLHEVFELHWDEADATWIGRLKPGGEDTRLRDR
jgi:hypothetical protein